MVGSNGEGIYLLFAVVGLLIVNQTLASLTTPASCDVQNKVVCWSSWSSSTKTELSCQARPAEQFISIYHNGLGTCYSFHLLNIPKGFLCTGSSLDCLML